MEIEDPHCQFPGTTRRACRGFGRRRGRGQLEEERFEVAAALQARGVDAGGRQRAIDLRRPVRLDRHDQPAGLVGRTRSAGRRPSRPSGRRRPAGPGPPRPARPRPRSTRTRTRPSPLRRVSIGPSRTSLPAAMIPITSASWLTSPSRWLEMNTVLPIEARWRSVSRIATIPAGSRPLAGSSRRSSFGSLRSAPAIPRRCFIPSE